ncbi:AraC family transcriptional regulator [Sphingomonas bacterium]|uniref:AraC family transcriptional regulator n=1 Tax=Sphingomonas bacterium TaxID=1895847 RepID=UPI001574F358|nr:AraC family transcriptional regulator [Sphingomonas bacterium]
MEQSPPPAHDRSPTPSAPVNGPAQRLGLLGTDVASAFATATSATRDSEAEDWSSRISKTFVPLHARPTGADPFFGQLRLLPRGPLLVACIDGSAQEVRHGPGEIATQGEAAVYLNLQLDGVGRVRTRQTETQTVVGGAAIVPSDEAFTLRFDQPFSQLCIGMSADWLADRLGFPATALQQRHLDTGRGVGRVVRAAIGSVIEAGDHAEAVLCGELFARTLAEALRMPAGSMAGGDARPDPLLAAIHSLIRRRLADVGLTPAAAAAALGCSLSTLHLHCQRGGRSFTTMVWEARLDAAATLLGSAPPGYGRVEAVAFACGFGDPSHFARRFKARFGTPPSLYGGRRR